MNGKSEVLGQLQNLEERGGKDLMLSIGIHDVLAQEFDHRGYILS